MRESRGARATYGDKGVALEVPRRRIFNWVHASIIGVALATVVTAWLCGFFDPILDRVISSGSEASCALHENLKYHWPFVMQRARSNQFSILIATIDHDDANQRYSPSIAVIHALVFDGWIAEGYGPNAVAMCFPE